MATLAPNRRPAFAVAPYPTQHAVGVRIAPGDNPLSEWTRQDARARGVADVTRLGADGETATVTPGCMPLP